MKMRAILFAASAVAFLGMVGPGAAVQKSGDLYGGVTAGMAVADLPASGYKDFACAEPKTKALSGWTDWKTCAADADGLHEMHVAVDEPGEDDTLVAGHPVDLTLGFNDAGRLARIVIETKRKGPMFLRKKAFLLGVQAKARYGDEGWACQENPLAADEEPLGSTSVNEHCVKSDGDRRITVDRSLFRKVGADPKGFTSQSHVQIDWTGS
jgi:hypothetical protein